MLSETDVRTDGRTELLYQLLLLLVELFDVEYYRDLEIWLRYHSRSFKLVPFESFGTVSYSQFPVVRYPA